MIRWRNKASWMITLNSGYPLFAPSLNVSLSRSAFSGSHYPGLDLYLNQIWKNFSLFYEYPPLNCRIRASGLLSNCERRLRLVRFSSYLWMLEIFFLECMDLGFRWVSWFVWAKYSGFFSSTICFEEIFDCIFGWVESKVRNKGKNFTGGQVFWGCLFGFMIN